MGLCKLWLFSSGSLYKSTIVNHVLQINKLELVDLSNELFDFEMEDDKETSNVNHLDF